MPKWLIGHPALLGEGAAKAVLMYLVALFGLRLAHRRTLAQWTAIDFAAAVAIGAIMGRTAIASGESFALGAVALLTLLAAHTVVTFGRYRRVVAKLVDHRVRVLVEHGELRVDQLRQCGLTDNDVFARLRQLGVGSLSELRYVLYETKGDLTVVRESGGRDGDSELVQLGLRDAVGFSERARGPAHR